MKERMLFAGLVASFLLAGVAQAQVAQLGRVPTFNKIKRTALFSTVFNTGCDSGCSGCADCVSSGGGCAGPSCGMAGAVLGGASCGLPEPACGSSGLGYAGGFGLCGGAGCDDCGVGGYFGRNIHPVNPCACGGSIVGEFARDFLQFFDNAVGTLVGGFFGGLRTVTCHASGSLAAIQCAIETNCAACGAVSCNGGCGGYVTAPGCGVAGPGCGVPISAESAGQPTPAKQSDAFAPPPTRVRSQPAGVSDPFLDDPAEVSRIPRHVVPRLDLLQNGRGNTLQRSGVRMASGTSSTRVNYRYLNQNGRSTVLRR